MGNMTLFEAIKVLKPGQCITMHVPGASDEKVVIAWPKGQMKPIGTLTYLWKSWNDDAKIVEIPKGDDRKGFLKHMRLNLKAMPMSKKHKFDLEWMALNDPELKGLDERMRTGRKADLLAIANKVAQRLERITRGRN